MVKSEQTFDEEDERRRYVIRLLIKHPTVDPSEVTRKLGLIPHLTNLVGDRRRNPAGSLLPGVYERSAWGYSVRVDRNRFFFDDVVRLIDTLEPHAEYFSEIMETGGTIDLIVHLPGDVNMGDDMPWHELGRLSALKINLGIEVFPHFN